MSPVSSENQTSSLIFKASAGNAAPTKLKTHPRKDLKMRLWSSRSGETTILPFREHISFSYFDIAMESGYNSRKDGFSGVAALQASHLRMEDISPRDIWKAFTNAKGCLCTVTALGEVTEIVMGGTAGSMLRMTNKYCWLWKHKRKQIWMERLFNSNCALNVPARDQRHRHSLLDSIRRVVEKSSTTRAVGGW